MHVALDSRLIPVRTHPRRRRLALVATPDGVEVRAPTGLSRQRIEAFVMRHRDWIVQALSISDGRQHHLWGAPVPTLTPQQAGSALERWMARALPEWQARMGLTPASVRVRPLRASWGCCTARGVVTLALDLAQLPPALAEYVLVHELAHLCHLHHGPAFWALVDQHLPDRAERVRALKQWEKRLLPLVRRRSTS